VALTVLTIILKPVFCIAVLLIGIFVTFLVSARIYKEFKVSFKEKYVKCSLETTFEDLKYSPEGGINPNIIASTEMMYMGDRYSSNDYISAKYKGVSFVQADVLLEKEHETRDSNGNSSSHYVTLFKGRWMVFDFNKEFRANIQVRQKGFGNAKVNNWFKKKESKYKRIELEDINFNSKYIVFAQNEHEAFYVLTPSLMHRIINVSNQVKGRLLFCFVNNVLHVGLQNGKDSFEHNVFKKIDEAKVIESVTRDIKVITSFVDELNLDNDLFKK
jgi:hypothetical protein